VRRLTALLVASLVFAATARAHDGPPYPILVDAAFGDKTLSIWADPDVGVGTFYLYLPEEAELADETAIVAAWVQPIDKRLPEVEHVAVRADANQPYQRLIEAEFDQRGLWTVRFTLADGATQAEIATEIDVTPPGLGRIDVLWFLMPFLLVAFLWGKAMHQRRAYARAASAPPPSSHPPRT